MHEVPGRFHVPLRGRGGGRDAGHPGRARTRVVVRAGPGRGPGPVGREEVQAKEETQGWMVSDFLIKHVEKSSTLLFHPGHEFKN